MQDAAPSRRRVFGRPPALCLLAGSLSLAFVVVLIPLAYAYPPDQTWRGGLYDDDDDYGAIELTSTRTVALVEPYRDHDHVPTDVAIATHVPCDDQRTSQPAHHQSESRAPPVR